MKRMDYIMVVGMVENIMVVDLEVEKGAKFVLKERELLWLILLLHNK